MTPEHYDHNIKPIDAIEDWNLNFNLGNVIKYIARADHKGEKLSDLAKAKWYLQREIDRIGLNEAGELLNEVLDKPVRQYQYDESSIPFNIEKGYDPRIENDT